MGITFYGDSLTVGLPGAAYFQFLRRCLPEHTLINRGKINDAALSLQRRLARGDLVPAADIAFIWIGVNDVLSQRSWFRSLTRRDWTYNEATFRQHYRLLLDTVCPSAHVVVTVSPALIGEDSNNGYNQSLANMASVIAAVTSDYANARYLDLHEKFVKALEGKNAMPGILQSPIQSVWDALTLRTDAALDQAVARRGLMLTLDGVHLSRAGAELAAKAFLQIIHEIEAGR